MAEALGGAAAYELCNFFVDQLQNYESDHVQSSTCSQEADSPKEERNANVAKYMPLGTRKKSGWPVRLVRPYTNCATLF